MPRNCWTRCNKTFPCSFPAREKTREIESRETSKRLEKQAILALLRKMIYKYELVNPVMVWIVNEHLLILRCVTEDAVYVDKHFSTIVNRNPATYMSKAERYQRLKIPDYFKYSIREGY